MSIMWECSGSSYSRVWRHETRTRMSESPGCGNPI